MVIRIGLTILSAWILKFFGFYNIVLQGMMGLFGVYVGIEAYYLLFVMVALLTNVFKPRFPLEKFRESSK